jgi:hypothetical protein
MISRIFKRDCTDAGTNLMLNRPDQMVDKTFRQSAWSKEPQRGSFTRQQNGLGKTLNVLIVSP